MPTALGLPNVQTHQCLSIVSFILAWVLFGKGKSLFSHFLEVFRRRPRGESRWEGTLQVCRCPATETAGEPCGTLRHACLRKPGSQAELGGGIQITTGRTQAGSPTWPLTREMGSGHKPGAGSLEKQKRPLRDNWGEGGLRSVEQRRGHKIPGFSKVLGRQRRSPGQGQCGGQLSALGGTLSYLLPEYEGSTGKGLSGPNMITPSPCPGV